MRLVCTGVIVALMLTRTASAQDYSVTFEGRPLRKVEVSFTDVLPAALTPDEAFKFSVRILERRGRYYWASRDMREMTRHESGAYVTFTAIDGSGYVRVGVPMMLDLRDRLPDEQRRKEIGYTEHLLTQFASITYFGNRLGAK